MSGERRRTPRAGIAEEEAMRREVREAAAARAYAAAHPQAWTIPRDGA